MNINAAVFIIVLLLPLAGLILSREGFSHQPKAVPITEEDLYKKLNIEKFDKRTPAPDFTLKDLNGNKVRLQDLRGKIVFLNFWATWCPTCRFEMPSMEALHKEFSNQGLVVLGIDFREGPKEIQSFYKEHNLSFRALLDSSAEAFARYEVWSLPTTFLIDKRGHIVGKVIGYRDWHSDQSKAFFTQLLKETA